MKSIDKTHSSLKMRVKIQKKLGILGWGEFYDSGYTQV
jgi:hypothetical protein